MPERKLIAKELADILAVIAHPARVRIIEELGQGEKDVTELVEVIGLAQPTVSQHLSALRGRRLVQTRREGRLVYYSLIQAWLAVWLLDGLQLIERESSAGSELLRAAKKARTLWKAPGKKR